VGGLKELPTPPPECRDWPWSGGEVESALASVCCEDVEWPSVAVVIPTFNHGRYLECAIRSILLQAYPRLELYVMDAGSTDESKDVIEKYADFLSGWRSHADDGQSAAINEGLRHSQSDVFGWLCADDFLNPGAFFRLMECRARNTQAVCWVGSCSIIDEGGRPLSVSQPLLGDSEAFADWHTVAGFTQPGCLFSARAFCQSGGLKEYQHFAMDVDLWVRMARVGTFVACEHIVATVRQYEDTKTMRDIPMKEAEYISIGVENGLGHIARKRLLEYVDRRLRGQRNRQKRHTGSALLSSVSGRALVREILMRLFRKLPATLTPRRRKPS
jgi:glycosyltransferase involved in cell wall biosynthesis